MVRIEQEWMPQVNRSEKNNLTKRVRKLKERIFFHGDRNYPERRKITLDYELREVQLSDIPEIAGWFQNRNVRDHIGEDRIDNAIPRDWKNQEQIRLFHEALYSFYLPPAQFQIEVKTPPHNTKDYEIIPTHDPENPEFITVTQKTHVCTINGILAGVQSWLTDDPYAPVAVREDIEAGKEKIAYGFVMITNPRLTRLHVASLMTVKRCDVILGKDAVHRGDFTKISGLVTDAEGWGEVFKFFTEIGYELGWNPDGHALPQMINGKEVEMWRMELSAKKWWKIRGEIYRKLDQKMNPRPVTSEK